MKVLFVHDHGVHAAHRAWAESVDADFLDSNPKSLHGFMLPIYSKLKRHTLDKAYDVILAEGGTCLPTSIKLKKRLGSKLFMISADAMFYDMPNYSFARKKYIQKSVKSLDGVIAVSSLSKKYAQKYVKCPICVVHPYANIEKFIEIKPKLNNKNILFVGKHRPDKNIEGLVKCFAEIKKEIPESTLTIIGGLNRERLPKSMLMQDGVNVLGHADFGVIKEHMKNSKLFMHISRFDPCPVAVTESMAAGLPPLISNGIGNKDFVPKELVHEGYFSKHAIKLLNKDLSKLSQKCKKISMSHTKKKSQEHFRKVFKELYM